MLQRLHLFIAILAIVGVVLVAPVSAVIIAFDDASHPVYDNSLGGGWTSGDNGGFGFGAWGVGQENGFGFGGGFTATNPPSLNIVSGPQNEAFGVYGNNGGVGSGIRNFAAPLSLLSTFSLDMDTQGVNDPNHPNGGGTVGFSLQNSGGGLLAEFYFIGGQSNYTVNAQNVVGTTPGFTFGGLHLAFTLTGLNSFLMTMDRLENGTGVDNAVSGNLLASGDQAVAQVRLFNANGGPDVYFNNMSIDAPPAAVPELSAFAFGGLVCCMVGMSYGLKVYRRNRMTNKPGVM